MSTETALKLVEKHDISDFEIVLLPQVFKRGIYVADRPEHVTIVYKNPETQKDYKATVKAAASRLDIWLKTFHRIEAYQIAGIKRRGPVL